ncbi:MAG: protein kinase [Deltaproteobacteria bacterium]|nr:protein kinase [Deltaproteobacteria bacterium]
MGSLAIAPGSILLGKYRVESVLGEGGMGVVFRARHIELDEIVAIKVLSQEMAISAETFARFAREAKAAARLKSPHVVRVTDVGKLPDGLPYMVMELLDGYDLSHAVRRNGPLPPPTAADYMIQVCEALTEAHELGIIHRDLKPSNLFVTLREDGTQSIKVLDFGIAKVDSAIDFSLTRTSSVLGTPGYMSPEQLRSSRTVDHRTDIWALGIVLYQLLEGRRPFDAEQFSELCLKIGVDAPPPLERAPPALAAIVLRCLAKRPEDRFQSVAELAVALRPFAGDPVAAAHEIDRMDRMMRSSARRLSSPSTPTPSTPHGRLDAATAGANGAPFDPDDIGDAVTTPANQRSSPIAATSTGAPADRAMAFEAATRNAPPRAPDGLSVGAPSKARAFPAYATADHAGASMAPSATPAPRRWRFLIPAISVFALSLGAAAAVFSQRASSSDVGGPAERPVPPIVLPPIVEAQPPVVTTPPPVDAAIETASEQPINEPLHGAGSASVDVVGRKPTRRPAEKRTPKPPSRTGSGAGTSSGTGADSSVKCDPFVSRHGC